MRHLSGGFTIVEIIIFMAATAAIFASAATVLSRNSSHTQFAVSTRDLHSKIQEWLNNASDGVPGGNVDDFKCHIAGGRLKIDASGGPVGQPDCVYLGRAIQFTDSTSPPAADQDSRVFAYSVFGRRLDTSDQLVGNLIDALPTPAIGNCPGPCNTGSATTFTDSYQLPKSIKIKKVVSTGASTTSHMAGFYLSYNTEQNTASNGNEDLKAYQYDIGNVLDESAEIYECINSISNPGNGSSCSTPGLDNPNPLLNWQICLTDDKDYAVITISSLGGTGPTTKLDFVAACP